MTPGEKAREIVLNARGFRECGSLQADIEQALLDTIEECAKVAEGATWDDWESIAAEIRKMKS